MQWCLPEEMVSNCSPDGPFDCSASKPVKHLGWHDFSFALLGGNKLSILH